MVCVVHPEPAPSILRCGVLALHHYELLPAVAVAGPCGNRDLFLRVLEQVRRRYRLVVVGYVVMPEHVHWLISEPQRGDPLKAQRGDPLKALK